MPAARYWLSKPNQVGGRVNCTYRSICSWPNLLLPFALLALSQSVLAQQPPSAGGQMLQIPPAPAPQRATPEIRIERRTAPATAASDQVKIWVRTLRVTGARVYPEADLIGLTGFTPGRELSLSDLRGMASRITEHYRANGYFLAQAYLPAQDIKDNAVTIAVSEGQYGNVTVRNETNLSDQLARSYLDGLNSGDVIVNPALESRLLLLSDLPGLKYGRGSYQMQFGRAQVGVAYSKLDYSLGEEFENLQAHGTAEIASIY